MSTKKLWPVAYFQLLLIHMFIMLTSVRRLIKQFLFFKRIKVYGKSILLPTFFRIEPYSFNDELWMEHILHKILILNPGVFIDVGANLGQTMVKVKSLKEDQQYFGFEPNPLCHHYSNALARINKYENVWLFPFGLSNKAEIKKLYLNFDIDSCGSVISEFRNRDFYSMSQFVSVFNGDYVINFLKIKSISIIKIDVEGGELEVIEGLKNSIDMYRPYIVCEVLSITTKNNEISCTRSQRRDELENLLYESNYKVCKIGQNGKVEPLNSFDDNQDLTIRDYLFVPVEHTHNIF